MVLKESHKQKHRAKLTIQGSKWHSKKIIKVTLGQQFQLSDEVEFKVNNMKRDEK